MFEEFDNQNSANIICPVCGIEGYFEAAIGAFLCSKCGGIFDVATREKIADIDTPRNPSLVVPFALDEKTARSEVQKQISKVKHVDKKYVDELFSKEWKAMYVPCYIVTCDALVNLSGRGTYKRGKDIVHESVETIIRFGFKDVPVIVKKGLSRDMLEDTGEFKLTGARAYEGESSIDGIEVLSSEFKPKDDPQKMWRRLDKLVKDVAFKQKLDYDKFVPNTGAILTDYSNYSIVYALVPLYIIDMPERHYFVNGVNGRLTGLDMIPLTSFWQERKLHPNKMRTAIKICEIALMAMIGLLGVYVGWLFRFLWPAYASGYCFLLAGLVVIFTFLACRVPWLFDKIFPVPKEYIRDDTLIYIDPSSKMTWSKDSKLIAVTTSDVDADNGNNVLMFLTKLFWPY